VWSRRRRKKFGAPPSQPKLIGAGVAGGVPAGRLRMDWYLRDVRCLGGQSTISQRSITHQGSV